MLLSVNEKFACKETDGENSGASGVGEPIRFVSGTPCQRRFTSTLKAASYLGRAMQGTGCGVTV